MDYTETENLLLNIVGAITKKPEEIEIHTSQETDEEGEIFVINIKVAPEDAGVCIGQGGSTAEALRRIVGLFGFHKTGKRYFVRIDAPKMKKNFFY